MKITLEPMEEGIKVAVADDKGAQRFWRAACNVMSVRSEEAYNELHDCYKHYSEQLTANGSVVIAHELWSYPVMTKMGFGVTIEVSFGHAMLRNLDLF